jgi:hypothetical protein
MNSTNSSLEDFSKEIFAPYQRNHQYHYTSLITSTLFEVVESTSLDEDINNRAASSNWNGSIAQGKNSFVTHP